MEKIDSFYKVTPSDLATLASRIDPECCKSDPEGAVAAAQTLLIHAENACAREEADRRNNEEWVEADYKSQRETIVDWARGIKKITKEHRRDRAIKRFAQFMKQEGGTNAKGDLSHYKRDGFTLEEMFEFQHDFANWLKQPKRKKGKQGRRISKRDRRMSYYR